ncbi:hypothetical protein FRB99_006389 [Tulasnella sp. 403]|nr:hypothetical protein FRB99_006389 [Tulasnella sp. 403]
MSDTKIRSTKLTFKGDKKSKKRKHRAEDDNGDETGRRRRKHAGDDAEDEDPQAWVMPQDPREVLGPTFIVHPSTPPTCIAYDSARGKIKLEPLHPKDVSPSAPSSPVLGKGKHREIDDGGRGVLDFVPTEVSHVWVVTRVAGSPTVNLRTADGKFLSCDTHGVVSSDREARGPQEEWTPVILPEGMVAFQNTYEKYLSVDEVAGGTLQLRGDSEEVGFGERFHVKIQAEYKRKAWEEDRKRKEVETMDKIDEAGTNKKYQAWGAGRSIVSEADGTDVARYGLRTIDFKLKKARKEGRLSEALLDRRAKLKSDPPTSPDFPLDSDSSTMTILLEVAAVGGACAVLKFVGPFLYNECFASDDDSWSEAGLHNSPPSERSPLLGVPGVASPRSSPRPNSLHLAAQLYSAHLEDRQRRASNSADSSVAVTPAATYSGLSTPSVSPSTPISTTSSYFDLRQPPLYVTDVQTALEKESKRRASNDFPKANLNAGFALSSAVPSGAVTPGSPPKMGQLTMVRRSSTPGNIGRPKPLTSDDALSSSASSQLVASLVCLLHARDMHDYFLTGKHIDEDIEDKQHRAVIDAFAATAQYFWPSGRYQSSPHLDLSVFHSLFKKSSSRLSSSPFPPSPYSSTSTLNGLPSSDSGAHTVSQLLHALHVALNEGENYTDQPTYLKAPFRVRSKSISSQASGKVVESDPQEEEGIRRHIDFLRNVNLIQEDSIVKDVFEGHCHVRIILGSRPAPANDPSAPHHAVFPPKGV